MAAYVGRRLAAGVGVILAVSLLVFAMIALLPGDAATTVLGRGATSPERVAAVRHELGLDKPPVERYLDWATAVLRGDLGSSLTSDASVAGLIGPRLRNTLILAALAAAVLFPLAALIGAYAGARAGSRFDHITSGASLVMLSLPEFVVATLLAYLLGIALDLVPPVALFDAASGPFGDPAVLVLPVLTIVITNLGFVSRMIRASVAEAIRSDYVTMARLNGVPERTVIFRYALRNALAPGLQIGALVLLYLIGGVFVVESVFQYPGIGLLAVEATVSRDLTTLQSLVVVIAAAYVIVNLLSDLAILAVSPKLWTSV